MRQELSHITTPTTKENLKDTVSHTSAVTIRFLYINKPLPN